MDTSNSFNDWNTDEIALLLWQHYCGNTFHYLLNSKTFCSLFFNFWHCFILVTGGHFCYESSWKIRCYGWYCWLFWKSCPAGWINLLRAIVFITYSFNCLTFSHTLTFMIIHYCRHEVLLFITMNIYYRITCPTTTTVVHNTTSKTEMYSAKHWLSHFYTIGLVWKCYRDDKVIHKNYYSLRPFYSLSFTFL